ncbi:hypothetical protein FRB99_005215 [Tulasnella sp. 403]|nr:hypothetical protein FRB99_005215 [Tulasnella sp. 403]
MAVLSVQELSSMKRVDLQKLCKDHNVKANLRTEQLVEALAKQLAEADLKQTQKTTGSIRMATAQRPVRLRKSLSQPNLPSSIHGAPPAEFLRREPTQIPERKPTPIGSSTRSTGVKDGKENGVLAPKQTKASVTAASRTTTTIPVSRGIAGRLAVFGKATGTSTKSATDPTSKKTQSSRPLQKVTTALGTGAEVEPSTSSLLSSRLQAVESAQAELHTAVSDLQKSSEATGQGLRKDLDDVDNRLGAHGTEIKRLQESLEASQAVVANQAAENEQLRQTVSALEERLSQVEELARRSTQAADQLQSRVVELESSNARLAGLEASLAALQQQLARSPPTPRQTQPSPSPFALGQMTTSFDGSPYPDFPQYQYLDLEVNTTPSSRRRNRVWRPELGQDALLQYNGNDSAMIETAKYDSRSPRNSNGSQLHEQFDQRQLSPKQSDHYPSSGDASPAGRASPYNDPSNPQSKRQSAEQQPDGYRETRYYAGHDGGDEDDEGFFGTPRHQVDTPPPAPPSTYPQPPQSHYQLQQQQQAQYRRSVNDSRRVSTATQQNIPNPPSPPPLFDHSHLRPGKSAQLLSAEKTLEMYRVNAKKTNDPEIQFQFAVLMLDALRQQGGPDSPNATTYDIEKDREQKESSVKDAIRMLQRLADRGHHEAQYFLADCYANGIGTSRGRQDFDKAYPLFVQAAKHRHADAAYRAGICCENGWGCRRDSAKAIQFYRTAGSLQHPGAMYRLGIAELNGELSLPKRPREGVKWLKRSSEHATPEFPHALHELALLHEQGIDNVVFVDTDYSAELLAQASELGYAPSAYRLGQCYEYGQMGCPMDPALSIHYYNIAAQQDHRDACFALTAWYLVGSPGVLPQSDTEAYLWAKKAADQGLAKAMYAVGYFTEVGIGAVIDPQEAVHWYKQAADAGDKRAEQRLKSNSAAGPLPGAPLGDREGMQSAAGQAGGNHGPAGLKAKDKDCIIM